MYSGENKTIGSKVKELRQERGWSSEYLAAQAGCSQATISYIENDSRRGLKYETLEKIAMAFSVRVIELLPSSAYDGQDILTSIEKRLVHIFRRVSPEEQKYLLQLLESMISKYET